MIALPVLLNSSNPVFEDKKRGIKITYLKPLATKAADVEVVCKTCSFVATDTLGL